jgi:hypothetical protein
MDLSYTKPSDQPVELYRIVASFVQNFLQSVGPTYFLKETAKQASKVLRPATTPENFQRRAEKFKERLYNKNCSQLSNPEHQGILKAWCPLMESAILFTSVGKVGRTLPLNHKEWRV